MTTVLSSLLIIGDGADNTVDAVALSGIANAQFTIKGFAGSDWLIGGGWNDKLYGGAGADSLDGGDGRDKL